MKSSNRSTRPSSHPMIWQRSMKEYTIALENYEKSLPNNHPDLPTTHISIATVLANLEDFQNAYEHEQKAVEIASQTFSSDHPKLQTFKNDLERMQIQLDENN